MTEPEEPPSTDLATTQAELAAAMRDFIRSADRSARWMLIATIALVVLTILIAILTLVLVIDPPSEPDL